MCTVPTAEKIDCGVLGASVNSCLADGCCWYTREFDGAPWCYRKSGRNVKFRADYNLKISCKSPSYYFYFIILYLFLVAVPGEGSPPPVTDPGIYSTIISGLQTSGRWVA